MNVLWEMAACERVLNGVLEGARGLIHGITCGAGMPYRLAEIAARYNVYYYPIVSSARAFRALWKRAYHRVSEWLGGVVYEDPWRAGGHNGLSNSEDPRAPEAPYPRVRQLRDTMRDFGLDETAIIMAGGVWHLRDWQDWLDNDELGPIGFQFGTRPLLTRESPISDAWKRRLLELNDGDVLLHRFSPTGFYSSAVHNDFLQELEERSKRQVAVRRRARCRARPDRAAGRSARAAARCSCAPDDMGRIAQWVDEGFSPGDEDPGRHADLRRAARRRSRSGAIRSTAWAACAACKFSNWSCNEAHTTGKPPDPRSFCIQKTLHDIAHGATSITS